MSKLDQKFSINGRSYHAFPDIMTFIEEAGIENATKQEKIWLRLDQEGITDISHLFSYTKADLIELGLSKKETLLLVGHLQRIRRRTSLVIGTKDLLDLEQEFAYLSTGNSELDYMLTYANGKTGIRSKTLVEFYGPAGIGKTQLLMTLAVMCIREEQRSGWGRSVVYIDTEGGFDLYRFYQIAAFYELSRQQVDAHLQVAQAYNFDEVDDILTILAQELRHRDLGMIIIDSIIDPLKSQYPMDEEFTTLQQRQQHLKQVCDKLKSLSQLHNLIAVFSNQVRSAMDKEDSGKLVPQGGAVLAHATDMRMSIVTAENDNEWTSAEQILKEQGIAISTVELIDCGFLPPGSADLLIGPFGTADPKRWKQLLKVVSGQDHLSINTATISGKKIKIEEIQQELYS